MFIINKDALFSEVKMGGPCLGWPNFNIVQDLISLLFFLVIIKQ
jgi:hypothetical protein